MHWSVDRELLKHAFLWRWWGHSFHHLTYESIDCSHSLSLPSLTLPRLKYIRSLTAFNKSWIYSFAKQTNKQYIKPFCYCKRVILINVFVVRVTGTWSSIYKWFVLACIKNWDKWHMCTVPLMVKDTVNCSSGYKCFHNRKGRFYRKKQNKLQGWIWLIMKYEQWHSAFH